MPIDFVAVAARYEAGLVAQAEQLRPLFARLAAAVRALERRSIEAERATSAYPVLRYRDEALCVTVDARLMPPLPAPSSFGFTEGLARGGRDFLAQMGWSKTAVQQETALIRLLTPVLGATRAVLGSLERFDRPRPELFDPDRARFIDIAGIANLTWSSLLGTANQADLRAAGRAVASAGPVAGSLGELFTTAFPDPAALGTLDPVARLVEKLDEKTKTFFDVVLFLPVVGLALDVAVHDGVLLAKLELLDLLGGIEASAFELRRTIVAEVLHASAFGSVVQAGVDVAETWARLNAWILSYELPRFTDELVAGLNELMQGLTAWGRWITDMLELFRSMTQAVMDFDLLPPIMAVLLPPAALALAPAMPRLTVDDLVSMAIAGGAGAARVAITGWLTSLELVLATNPLFWDYAAKVGELRTVLGIALTPTPFTYPPDVMPTGPLAPFPDVFEEVFGGGRRALFMSSLDDLGVEIRGAIGGVFDGVIGMSGGLATTAGAELDRMAQSGSGLALGRFATTSGDMAAGVFGPERAELLARRREPSPLAVEFDRVMAVSGIALAAAMIPAYIGTIRRFWATRNRPTAHPTSAHILARHGRLAAVRVPRLTITAVDRDPSDELADRLAAEVRATVLGAFRDGRDRFTQLAADTAPRGRTGGGGRGG